MKIKGTTTITQLRKEKLIGIGTTYILLSLGINDINSLKKYTSEGQNFQIIRNIGNKDIDELKKVLALATDDENWIKETVEYEKFNLLSTFEKKCFEKVFANVPVTDDEKVGKYIRERYSKPCFLFYELFYDYEKILEIIPSFSTEENNLFRKYTIVVLENFIDELLNYIQRSNMPIVGKADNILLNLKKQKTNFN